MSIQLAKMTEEFPFYFFVSTFVSGLVLLFFSPVRILLPSWIIYPFSGDIVNLSASLVSIIICSFCLGVPLYLFDSFLTGNSGVNNKMAGLLAEIWQEIKESVKGHRVEDKTQQDRPTDEKPENNEERLVKLFDDEVLHVGFPKWVKDNYLETTLRHLGNQYHLLKGLVIGSEICLSLLILFDWWFILLLNFLKYPINYPVNLIEISVWLILFPFLIFVFSWFCSKYHFRKLNNDVWRTIKIKFMKHLGE